MSTINFSELNGPRSSHQRNVGFGVSTMPKSIGFDISPLPRVLENISESVSSLVTSSCDSLDSFERECQKKEKAKKLLQAEK